MGLLYSLIIEYEVEWDTLSRFQTITAERVV